MKKFLLCSASALAITIATSSVRAADEIAAPMDVGWNGWYFGGHLGAGKTTNRLAEVSDDADVSKGGALGGLQLGHNWDDGNYIWGIETDVTFADLQRVYGGHSVAPDGIASIRGRLGKEIGSGAFAYVTGGAAVLWGTTTSSAGDSSAVVNWRPVVGAGVEAPLSNNLTIRAEGLAYFGSDTESDGISEANTLDNVYVARLGINYVPGGTTYERAVSYQGDPANSTWDGWYFGGHLGAAKMTGILAIGSNTEDYTFSKAGALGGLQLGWNQESGSYIWGIEGDLSFVDLTRQTGGHNVGPDAMSTLRARWGMEVGNGAYAYVTGGAGALWGTSTSSDGSSNDGYLIWRPVVGVGVEAPLNELFTLRAEGLAFFGQNMLTGPSDPNQIDDVYVARLGLNYHLGGTTYGRSMQNAVDPANSSWTGYYAGAHLGAGKTSGELAVDSDDYGYSKAGLLGGLQLGYNQENGSYVWGIEGDWTFADLQREHQAHSAAPDAMGSIRGRIGMEVGGGTLAYLTAGAGVLLGTTTSSAGNNTSFVNWRPVVGAGVETALNEYFTVRAEGLAFLGSDDNTNVSDEDNVLDDVYVARLGINYHLNGTTYGRAAANGSEVDVRNGYYVGAHLGAGKTSGDLADGSDDFTYTVAGGLGGLQVGYNQDNGNYRWGIESDVTLADLQRVQGGHSMAPDLMASLRGRVGVGIGNDGSFAYVTGGAGLLVGTTTSSEGGSANDTYHAWRPVIGFGVETPLKDNITVRAEALSYIGSNSEIAGGGSESNRLDDVFVARIGINLHM